MKSNLIFIGMPAVGKSTVGIVVAKRLGKGFIDSDLLIQEQEGKLLREIIAEVGDDGFLKIENQVNRDIKAENAVISPGGSVVYCEEAFQRNRNCCISSCFLSDNKEENQESSKKRSCFEGRSDIKRPV